MTESKQPPKGDTGTFFGRAWGFIKRHRKGFIILAVLAVLAGVLMVMLGGMNSAAAGITQAPQTLTLARMDLEQIVSGTGTLQSATTRTVTSGLSYDITAVYVAEGDRVEAGQALAQLDTTDLDKSIADVRKSIAEAEASDALSRTQTERKLQDAIDQYNIDETKHNKAVSGAESTLNAAKKEKSAAADERKAKKAVLDAAQAAVDGYAGDTGLPEYTDLVNALTAAQGDYDLADQAYQGKKTAADQAQSAYDSAVQLRDTTLRQDNISIENTRDSIDSLKLKDSASAYRSQLEGYLEDREKCVIEAPVSGTVTAMTAEVGQSAGGSAMGTAATAAALFTIEDTDRLEITASIPEYDAILVQVGMQVSITSDAIDGTGWTGTVKSISPKATDASGNFTVVVEVVSPVGELAIGMSAKINIITEAETGVFAVPYDAVTTNAQGESVVYLLDTQAAAPPEGGGEAPGPAGTPMVVETGMETDYYIEISAADLEEGLVILADPEGKNVSTDSGGSGMAGFRVGGGG